MVPAMSVCKDCKHYTLHLTCKAFPEGIPDEIAFNGMPHEKILPNQKNNIVFEKRT
ncbi:MAG: cytoplasmic protein [Bacteroidia bacterium]|nr:cytoplasmic protein [Bacteroidia bacterium]